MHGEWIRRRAATAAPLLLLACISACGPGRVAEGWKGRGSPWFEAQLLSGFSPDGRELATLVVTVPHRNLVFFAADDRFVSNYRIRAVQKSGRAALSSHEWTGSVSVDSYEETRSQSVAEKTVQLELASDASAAAQTIVVSLSVERTQRRSSLAIAYEPAQFNSGGVTIAEAEFYLLRDGEIAPAQGTVRLGDELVPDSQSFARASARQFDLSTGEPWLWIRIFDLRAMPRETLTLRVGNSGDARSWNSNLELGGEAVESSFLIRVPSEALRFGENELRIDVEGVEPRTIELANLGLDLRDTRSWNANLAHIEALASSGELKRLRTASADERETEWREFWHRRDPTPDQPGNERLDEHHRRVSYARRHLRDGVRQGSISDRGRVYIQFGAPDSIEDVSSRSDALTSWQLWRYPRQGVVYYFRLVHGGNYRFAWSERY